MATKKGPGILPEGWVRLLMTLCNTALGWDDRPAQRTVPTSWFNKHPRSSVVSQHHILTPYALGLAGNGLKVGGIPTSLQILTQVTLVGFPGS